jgi:hypothetical protein
MGIYGFYLISLDSSRIDNTLDTRARGVQGMTKLCLQVYDDQFPSLAISASGEQVAGDNSTGSLVCSRENHVIPTPTTIACAD